MKHLNKIFAILLIVTIIAAATPFVLLKTESDIIQVTQEIRLGEKNAKPQSPPGKPVPNSPDYKLSINKAKTDIPVTFTVYASYDGLEVKFITNAIASAAQTWDDATSVNLLLDYNNPVVIGTGTAKVELNGENAVFFADYSDSNVIAMASYWYSRVTKEILECDILFNTDFQWGDASINPSIMDLQNIATHEIGHFFNLADIYDTSKNTLTMYGISWEGDIQKRDLEPGDIAGIKAVFGQ
ncbi:MAG: matrixin family metalloprotease [Candidatus Bathyarchaeota archaeon]|jgi:hypothetical protein|nr:matrixin family metalloprotease [Candidatus Bathyarchaeota archaeon]